MIRPARLSAAVALVGAVLSTQLEAQTTGQALTAADQEAQAMGLQMAFACSPRRHGEARAAFRDRVTAAVRVQVEDVTGYEVTFAHLDALEIASDSFPRPAPLPEATGGGETAG